MKTKTHLFFYFSWCGIGPKISVRMRSNGFEAIGKWEIGTLDGFCGLLCCQHTSHDFYHSATSCPREGMINKRCVFCIVRLISKWRDKRALWFTFKILGTRLHGHGNLNCLLTVFTMSFVILTNIIHYTIIYEVKRL